MKEIEKQSEETHTYCPQCHQKTLRSTIKTDYCTECGYEVCYP